MLAGQSSSSDLAAWLDKKPNAVALLPFGAFEQHGPHLPLTTDSLIAEAIAKRAEQAAPDLVCLFPCLPIGASSEHIGFAGTISIQPETLVLMLNDIFDWLTASDFQRIILYNGHGGNQDLAQKACDRFKAQKSVLQLTNFYAYTLAVQQKSRELFGSPLSHAGSSESSLLAALLPELGLKDGTITNKYPYSGGRQLDFKPAREFAPEGIIEKSKFIETNPNLGEELAQTMLTELNTAISTPTQL